MYTCDDIVVMMNLLFEKYGMAAKDMVIKHCKYNNVSMAEAITHIFEKDGNKNEDSCN
jgi:hypothetical protein